MNSERACINSILLGKNMYSFFFGRWWSLRHQSIHHSIKGQKYKEYLSLSYHSSSRIKKLIHRLFSVCLLHFLPSLTLSPLPSTHYVLLLIMPIAQLSLTHTSHTSLHIEDTHARRHTLVYALFSVSEPASLLNAVKTDVAAHEKSTEWNMILLLLRQPDDIYFTICALLSAHFRWDRVKGTDQKMYYPW